MQRYTIFFIVFNVLHVSSGFSAHHREFKNCTHNIWYIPNLLAATTSVGDLELTHVKIRNLWHEYCLNNKSLLLNCTTACCLTVPLLVA